VNWLKFKKVNPVKKNSQYTGTSSRNRSVIPKALKWATILVLPLLMGTIVAATQTVNEQVKQESKTSQTEQPKPYAIIVGAFKSLKNAEGLVSHLKAKGYEAAIAGQSATGLFRISIQSYSDKDEAYRQLTLLRSNGFSGAWVLAKDEKVYKGIADTTTVAPGQLYPRKQVAYTYLPESVRFDPKMVDNNENTLFDQFNKLREVLRQYREIETNGGWNTIDLDPKVKAYLPGDTAKTILQIRKRLFITGDLEQDNKSNRYDPELVEVIKKYQMRNGYKPNELILPEHIREMNIPIDECIKKIIVNMERCRQISPEFAKAKKFIVVNIPAFQLHFVRNGKTELMSPVVVGDDVTKTVIFSGMLSSVVFCPYWNVPQSIINKEIKPRMAKNKDFLKDHDLEWNNGQVRQKPGKNNALGLVKFIFPNSNDIYMHDTPAKSLFARENRAFSHGCIRVGKSRDLAIAVLKDDGWTPEKIDTAMNAGKESIYVLKNKIPVYIGYFTAWVDEQGMISFYDDIYYWDISLSHRLFDNK
jgi:L,D-transpeptidase YcbB